MRQNIASARNLVRPFKRIGIFTDDGKPTSRYWDWMDDSKYPEACQRIIHDIYPETVAHTFTVADDDERVRLGKWFERNLDVLPKVAGQYASFYMLLLSGDLSRQDEAAVSKPPRAPRTTSGQAKDTRSRSNGAKAQASTSATAETRTSDTTNAANGHESEHHYDAPKRVVRGIEPSLNINVQIHIPAEASPDQIDQIFKSMAKHLYQRQDEAGE